MANKKKLQKAAIKFRKENQRLYYLYSALLSGMANFIITYGAAEVTTGIKNGKYYINANNQH